MIPESWWLTDITVSLGCYLTFKHSRAKNALEESHQALLESFLLGGKQLPQQLSRRLNEQSASSLYYLITFLFIFSMVWNVVVNLYSPRNTIVNVLYGYLSLTFTFVSAKAVLLDNEISTWNEEEKFRYILFPVNLKQSKIYTGPLPSKRVDAYFDRSFLLLQSNLFTASFLFVAVFTLTNILPILLFPLLTPLLLWLNLEMNLIINSLLDMFCLKRFRTRIYHPFSKISSIITKGKEQELYGKHYFYFKCCNKPLTKVCKKLVYNHAKKRWKCSKAESKAFMFVARCFITLCCFFVMNLLNYDLVYKSNEASFLLRLSLAIFPYITYYSIHAFIAFYNENSVNKDWFNETWKRKLALGSEILLAGHFFYLPLVKLLVA